MRARTCAKHTDSWREWRNHYCGTCKTIGARYGQAARMSLNHDTVFLAELLTALIPDRDATTLSPAYRSFNCMTLPKTEEEMPAMLRFSAAATLVLTEFKVIDHIEDTNRRRWRTLARLFSKAFRKAEHDLEALDFPTRELRESLSRQSTQEREGTTLHDFAAPTAEATRLFFAHGATLAGQTPETAATLATLGARFGQLAYILDAFEDYEKDAKSGAFNALKATNKSKNEIVPQLMALNKAIAEDLKLLPLKPEQAASFAQRLKANLDAKLGLHICQPRRAKTKPTRKQRWESAKAFARTISDDSPKWRASITVASVALIAYLAPSHSRAATTPSECLSLSFNLMALGSIFAMAASGGTPPLPPVDPSINPGKVAGKAGRSGKSGCCSNCGCGDCDCCCDLECCACEACACESCGCGSCCGGCGDCCGGCGDCGDCCSGCDC